MKRLKYSWLLLLIVVSTTFAQDVPKITADDVTNKTFLFKAQSTTPLGGTYLVLNYPYDVRIAGDSLISNLPYFGRAYSAPMNPNEAGLTFTTTKFTYEVTKSEDGKFEITVETKDQRDSSKMFFTLYANGGAQLLVQPFNKQTIRYDGSVEVKKK
jgi:hypothetical protein